MFSDLLTFAEAQSGCQSQNDGMVFEPRTQDELDFVQNRFQVDQVIWAGINDDDSENM